MIRSLVEHSTTVLLAVLCIFLFGLQSYNSLPRESAPDIPIPVVMVSTPYIGVAPEDIEGLVTIPIENELASLRDVKKMSSSSLEGASVVTIEFEPDVVIEDALQKVRDRVNRAKPKLPEDVNEPNVAEISFSDFPILIVTIAGDLDEESLKDIAEDLQDELLRIDGVLDAKITGGQTREIQIQVDPLRLAFYGLSLNDVVGAVANENSNIPGGNVDVGDGTVLLRVPGEFDQPLDIEQVAIKRVGDRPVFVKDVARVVDGFQDRSSYSRMNGQTAVSVSITKRTGANILQIAEACKEKTAEVSEDWPAGVEYRALGDQSIQIRNMVSELENNIITALILVVGVVLFFMGARNSLFVAVAIPLSMLMSFIAIQALGFTLNMIVLFSLILALGMLVDNGIVVVENIYRFLEEGKDLKTASIEGTREVAMAVAASTATTVAAFLPMIFWTGIMGEFMGYLPKTLIMVLVSSLIVGVCILPVLTSRFMTRSKSERSDGEWDGPVMQRYKRLLQLSIDHRYISAGIGFASLIFTFVAYGFLNHGTEFFPETDPNRGTVTVRAPEGTALDTTDRVLQMIEAALSEDPNVDVFVAETGIGGASGFVASSQGTPNEGRVTVDFLPDRNSAEEGQDIRVEPTPLTISRFREFAQIIPGVEIEMVKEEMGPPVGSDIEVEVSAEDFHTAGAAAMALQREIAKLDGATDLSNNYRVGRPEVRLRIDRGAAKRVGVSTAGVGNAVRNAIAGTTATTLREGEDEYDVVVAVAPEHREDLQSVLDLRLPGREDTSPDTFPVPLSAVASFDLAGGSGTINHIDQDLVVTISGDVKEGYNVNAVQAEVLALLDSSEMPAGVHAGMGGSNQEQKDSQAFLSRAFMIALALILMVLVTQFDSLAIPVIILCSVVLSLVGVLWGLIITGTPFGIMMTGIGVISLAGVVVNNAIVLLDYVQQLRDRGLSVQDALVRAGMTRFRPVILTAITTILGLVPMALGISFDFRALKPLIGGSSAQFWGPMAWAVIFGLGFATILTLVMVPTLYSIYDDMVNFWARRNPFQRATPVTVSAGAALLAALGGLMWAAPAHAVTLDEAIAAAEENSVTLALATEQRIQAETLRGQAWTLISPKLQAQGSYTVNENESYLDFTADLPAEMAALFGDGYEPILIQPKTNIDGNVTVVQPLFNGSALPLLRSAYKNAESARLTEARQRQQVRAGVAGSYYGLVVARESLALAEQAVENAAHQLDLATRQSDAGLGTRRTVVQAELALAQAQRDVVGAREQLIAAEEGFANLTGLPRDSDVAFPAGGGPALPGSLDEALDTAMAQRPDIAAGEYAYASAALQNRAHWLGWLPVLQGQFSYVYNQNPGFVPQNTFWVASVNATWTVWDGGLRIAQGREKASILRSADLMTTQTTQTAEQEVRTAWESYQRAQAAVTAVERELALATENLTLAERGFGGGSATWLEVEAAELGLQAAKLAGLSEKMALDLAAIDLLVATGTY